MFRDVGWGRRHPNDIKAAFARSSIKAFAFGGNELIGFGRTIDDGKYYATLVDLVVCPARQRQGVGRAILQDLHSQLDGYLIATLTAAPEVQGFYRKMGWRNQSTSMIRPRSKEQERLN